MTVTNAQARTTAISSLITNEKCHSSRIVDFFLFLSTLFIGADVFGINVGVNIRLDQLFLLITAVLMIANQKYRITLNKPLIFFLIFSFLSTLFSYNFNRGILFFASIVYNVFFVYLVYFNYVKYYGYRRFFHIFRSTIFVQFCVFMLQVFLKIVFDFEFSFMPTYGSYLGVTRFRLWFYEPSYLATFLSFYFCYCLYLVVLQKKRQYIVDITACLIEFVLSTSSTGFVAIGVSFLFVYLIYLIKGKNTRIKLMMPLIVIALLLLFKFTLRDTYDVFFTRLFRQKLDASSGGRTTTYIETWNVFINNFLLGVGPGNYGLYVSGDAGKVPSNVTLELLATLGIFGTISFYAISLHPVVKCVKKNSRSSIELKAFCLALVVFTLILQVNQGYLRLYHWMFFGVVNSICYLDEKLLNPKIQNRFFLVAMLMNTPEDPRSNLTNLLER